MKKYGIIILIIIFIFVYYKKYDVKETMICDLNRPEYNYFFKNQLHLIEKYELRKNEVRLLISLFDKNTFIKNGYNKDNKSLSEFVKLNNLEGKKDDFIGAVNELLNDNRYYDNSQNYKVTLDTKISQIRHIWLLDKIISDLKCVLDDSDIESFAKKIKTLLNDKPIRLCSQSELLNYCSKVGSNPKIGEISSEILEDENKLLKKGIMGETDSGVVSRNFKLVSIKSNVSKFGIGYFSEPFNTILEDLLSKFEEKYSRKYDNFDRNDLTKLVLIYVPMLQEIIDRNANTSINSPDKKKTQLDLEINKEMFYLLKHQYKIVSIYTLINTKLDDVKEKELAYNCCVNSGDKSNMCYDFAAKQEDSKPIVYGFNQYGYVKDTPCSPESKKDLFDLQNKTLEIRLLEDKSWNKVPLNVKKQFYNNLKNLLNYFLVTKLESKVNLMNVSIVYILGVLKNQNINLILPEKIDTVNNTINFNSSEVNQIVDTIQVSNSYATIKKLMEKEGITEDHFNFSSLADNLKKLRFASIKILEIKSLLDAYNVNPGKSNLTVSRLLALSPTNFSYYDILISGGISPRYHDDLINNFVKIISDIRLLKTKTITLNKKPKNVITYLEKLFPEGKDMDTCSIYLPVLKRLRSLRNITPVEYIYYKDNFGQFCESRDKLISKEKPILFKDINGKIVEITKKNIMDINDKKITVFTIINSNGEFEIVNLNKNNNIEYSGIIIRNGEMITLDPSINKDYVTVNTITSSDNKNFTVGEANIKLSKILDEEILADESTTLPKYDANEVLDATTIDTKVDNSNKNILNLINNYFDFEN